MKIIPYLILISVNISVGQVLEIEATERKVQFEHKTEKPAIHKIPVTFEELGTLVRILERENRKNTKYKIKVDSVWLAMTNPKKFDSLRLKTVCWSASGNKYPLLTSWTKSDSELEYTDHVIFNKFLCGFYEISSPEKIEASFYRNFSFIDPLGLDIIQRNKQKNSNKIKSVILLERLEKIYNNSGYTIIFRERKEKDNRYLKANVVRTKDLGDLKRIMAKLNYHVLPFDEGIQALDKRKS